MAGLQDKVEKVSPDWFDHHWSIYGLDKEAQKKILGILGVRTGLGAILTFTNKSAPIAPSDLIEKLVDSGIADGQAKAESIIEIITRLGMGMYDLSIKDVSGKTHYQVVPVYLNPVLVTLNYDDPDQ